MNSNIEVTRANAAMLDLNKEIALSIEALRQVAESIGWTVEYSVTLVPPSERHEQ